MGIAKASVPYGREDSLPEFIFKPMLKIKMETLTNGKLASFFLSNDLERKLKPTFVDMEGEQYKQGNSLIPVIFCHGLSSNRTMHSGTCRDLASHGYIVFSPDHMDLTSSYYESADG